MEIKCEKCGQEEGQTKTAEEKLEAKDICANTVENIYTRKKREDVSGRAKRSSNRTVYGREQREGNGAVAKNKQKYVFEVATAKN